VQLILWDIDGTLVTTAGHGRYAFFEAFQAVFGRPVEDDPPVAMGGRTDHSIAIEVMEMGGVEDPERHLPAMYDALHEALRARAGAIAAEGGPQPGVAEAISAIDARGGAIQSLLTGNIEPNAHVKLGAFGLDELVEMDIGGYGSDHGVRAELVGIARRKARAKHGVDIPPERVTLIGDTPLDIEAAHASGARAVAVATGPYTVEELEQAGPEAALEDLSDTGAVLAALPG
jgi:phosphoglycolate phosphatase-like HAD superfamily hydrolase